MGPCCSGLLVGESSACFWASGSSVPLRALRETPELLQFARGKQGGRCMRSYPWSSPGNFLFQLPDMVMWHLQQVAPIRSEHSVTVTPPEVQTPCDRATQPARNPAGFYYLTFSLQDWFIFLDVEKRNPFVFFAFHEVCSCLCANFPLLSVWLTLLIWSSCSSCRTLKNNLWESRESAADCSEHISGTEEWIDRAVTSGRTDRPFGWRSLWCSQKQKPVSSLDVCQRLQPGFIYFYGVCCCISLCSRPWIHFFQTSLLWQTHEALFLSWVLNTKMVSDDFWRHTFLTRELK